MCKHTPLAKNADGVILWCNECKVFSLHYNNIIMTLDEQGFGQFKKNMSDCYIQNHRCPKLRHQKDILFETKLDGLRLRFSSNDVGSLLSLLQLAGLNHYGMKYFV